MRTKYLKHEQEVVQKVFKGEITIEDAVKLIDRTTRSIRAQLNKLRKANGNERIVKKGQPRSKLWSVEEMHELVKCYNEGGRVQDFAKEKAEVTALVWFA